MLDGFKKDDLPTVKKMSCTIDLPEKNGKLGARKRDEQIGEGGGSPGPGGKVLIIFFKSENTR